MNLRVVTLILAAGQASRMRQPKQLLPMEGKPMLRWVIENAMACQTQAVCCILGAYAEDIKAQIPDVPITWLFNPHWQLGLSSSMKQGIQYVMEHHPDAEGVLMLLGDQPLMAPAQLKKYLKGFKANRDKVIAAAYGGQAGVPALFPKRYLPDLLELSGDKGARTWLRSNQEQVELIPELPTLDVDTMADYQKLLNKQGNKQRE